MKMDQQERMDRIEAGSIAITALAALEHPMTEYRDRLISKLVTCYRNGQTQHDVLLGLVAELAALDNVKKDLETTVHRGNVAAQEEYK